jgi:hypothetical protein
MKTIAPRLAPPVSRQPVATQSTTENDVDQSIITVGPVTISFASDDDD